MAAAQGLARLAGQSHVRTLFSDFEEVNAARGNRNGRFDNDDPRQTVAGAALGQVVANRGMFQTETVEPPAVHPDIARAQADRALLEQSEQFIAPDNFGLIECVVCKYGVFNESTQNTAMGHFQAMYFTFCERMRTAQMFAYMARFWNGELRQEYPNVPPVTLSAVRFHFETCTRRRNVVQRLQDQVDKIERAIDVVEETSLYLEPTDGGPDDSDEDRRLPPEDRALLVGLGAKLDAMRKYMERPIETEGDGGTTVVRRGLGSEAEGRICHMMGQMVSHVAGMSRRRARKRKRVVVSEDGLAMFDKLSGRMAQTAKVLLEWRKYEDSVDIAKQGLPAYCSQRKTASETLIDIYSNKKVQGGNGPTPQDAAAHAAGDMTGRFAAY